MEEREAHGNKKRFAIIVTDGIAGK
jgi:hypothetical protein